MSLAQSFVDEAIGMQSPSVPTTATQQQYLTNLGLPVPANLSWFQALQIEAERRVSDVTWNATLCPTAAGKLGVSVTSTDGGTAVAETTNFSGALADSVPSETVISGLYVPTCTPVGVKVSTPVLGSSVAPAGRPVAV